MDGFSFKLEKNLCFQSLDDHLNEARSNAQGIIMKLLNGYIF